MKRALLFAFALLLAVLVIRWRYARNAATTVAPEANSDRGELRSGDETSAPVVPKAAGSGDQGAPAVPANIRPHVTGADDAQTTMSAEEHWQAYQARRILAAIDADIAAGINAEVREREAVLRQGADSLVAGMNRDTVLRFMGPPVSVKVERSGSMGGYIPQTNLDGSFFFTLGPTQAVVYRYTPRDDATYIQRNGFSYHLLFVRFDPTGEWLARWHWEPQDILFTDERRQWQKWEDYARAANLTQPK